jgi:uncharacterized protein YjbI with pentapeptide repeats
MAVRPDLSGAYLVGADLLGANLSGANMNEADLRGADLRGADLTGADLTGARLSGANLRDADLTGARLSGAAHIGARLRGADLSGANLRDANLYGADLSGVDLFDADLRGANGANLIGANLSDANLSGANMYGANLHNATLVGATLLSAYLSGAYLSGANLSGANLRGANLSCAHLRGFAGGFADLRSFDSDYGPLRFKLFASILDRASLNDVNLTEAVLGETVFANVDLAGAIGLETCKHEGPSTVDHRTLQKSGPLPLSFLRGVGLPDNFIEYLPSLLNQAIQHYSCFISYSTKDDDFAKRIHADLQNSGVRCWFAPHDLRIGDKIRDEIDAAIRLRDKLLLILSEYSIKSDWVENEVEQALEEERKRGQTVLFPLYIDEAWKDTNKAWAATIRRQRHIGDFRGWKDHDAYQQSFARVLRDLKPREVSPKVP